MDDEKLIECVRKYEFIYNLQHAKYMDSKKKEKAWEEIAALVKQPASSCRQRWQALRDAYRRATNKKKGKTGRAAQRIKKWKYEDEMSFVVPFFVERKPSEPVELISGEENAAEGTEIKYELASEVENFNADDEINSTNNAVNVASFDEPVMETKEFSEDEITVQVESIQTQVRHSNPKRPFPRTGKKTRPIRKANVVLGQTSLLKSRLNRQIAQHNYDELDHFFLSISETVKKFPPYLQAIAKNRIFGLVSGMELQQLAPSGSHIPSPSTSMDTSNTPWTLDDISVEGVKSNDDYT